MNTFMAWFQSFETYVHAIIFVGMSGIFENNLIKSSNLIVFLQCVKHVWQTLVDFGGQSMTLSTYDGMIVLYDVHVLQNIRPHRLQ